MKRNISRILSLAMIVCVIFTVLPVSASAASASSILNSAKLTPDHFLAEGSNSYYTEVLSGLPALDEFYPEDADALIVKAISQHTSSSMSTYEKVKALYKFIIDNTSYEYGGYGNYNSVYSVLVDHIGTCADYNYVMMAFLRYLGIDASLVYGQTRTSGGGYTGHQWAEAYINGKTYVFDPQIDDNIAKGGSIGYYRFCMPYSDDPGAYILNDPLTYTLLCNDAEAEDLYYAEFEAGDTLRDMGFAKLKNTDFGFKRDSSSVFMGWCYDEAGTELVNLNAPLRRDTMIWAGWSIAPYVDVPVNSVYADAVRWATDKNITKGTDATHFAPKNPCTRGQVVTFLWRAAGCPEPKSTKSPFVDVKNSGSCQPFYKAILWAAEKGITTGIDKTHFDPNATVTRAQFVTFLWRYEGKPSTGGSINGFKDEKSIAKPFKTAVAWAVENKITTGYDDKTFRPSDTCTRWAVVLFMYRDLK